MGNIQKGLTCLLLIGSAASTLISFNVQAEGNGVIVLNRDVQPIPIGRNGGKDPYPTTVNANPSARINSTMNSTELSDGDFAGISSGAGISNLVTQQTNNLGGNLGNQNQLPNLAGGRGTGSGNGISNMVNSSVQRGLAPLQILTGGGK